MMGNRKNLLSFMLMGILFSSFSIPAYAEVENIQTDKLFYSLGDKIIFSGIVDNDDTGLVTIVIRDSNDKFVLLTQAFINPDNSFKRSVDTNEKFSAHGIYNASAFLVNMTEGSLTRFDYSLDGSPVSPSVVNLQDTSNDKTTITNSQTGVQVESEPKLLSKIASFVDTTKDPQHYIDRYNDELAYKEWFDTNYPDLTIYEAVAMTPTESIQEDTDDSIITEPPLPTQELSQSVVESSTVNPTLDTGNAEVGQMLLALGGLGILFGAVYGVKRKVDSNTVQIAENKTKIEKKVTNNTEQISQNRFWLKKKLMNLKPGSEPVSVIRERLAKGEITVDEYYKLLRALKK